MVIFFFIISVFHCIQSRVPWLNCVLNSHRGEKSLGTVVVGYLRDRMYKFNTFDNCCLKVSKK
jgi:hypothetical protein